MCTILFAFKTHPHFPLLLLANRDEFYNRPTLEMHHWEDGTNILAGKDLEAGGTWFGVHPSGRWAAVTNHRKFPQKGEFSLSRGHLIRDFLVKGAPFDIASLDQHAQEYNGYNCLFGQGDEILYHSNRGGDSRFLAPGIYGLSNAYMDSPWPKVQSGKEQLKNWVDAGEKPSFEEVINLMHNQEQAAVEDLPDTGIGLEWEKVLSSLFIKTEKYGTHCTTYFSIDRHGKAEISERNYQHQSERTFVFENWNNHIQSQS